MIKEAIDILNADNHYGVSEQVEIAKGKYEYVTQWKQGFKKIKRILKYGRKSRNRH